MRLNARQQLAKDRYIRKKYAKDLIQPTENSFKLYYPKQYAKMEHAREQQDLKEKQDKESKEQFFNKYKNSLHRHSMKNALKLEEKLEHGKR